MAKKKPKPAGSPQGEAVQWSEADIERLAEITPEDIASAKAHWNRLAPKRIKRVLDAKKEDGEDA